ncbi:MAG TPA: PAS domain-containing sensor histidine kinase [Gaiellaceae bacterium]|nr:PAS domain-containing sensor histidine kinase [Gaiellaceae bacterium]
MSAPAPTAERPPRLVLRFAAYSALALLAAGVVIFWVVRHETQSRAERDLAARGERVAARIRAELRPSDVVRPVSPQRARALDRAFADEISDDLVLVKVWTRAGVLAYASDHRLVGARSQEAGDLEAALAGRTLREVVNMADEGARRDLKTIETLVPLRQQGTVVGALDLYFDYASVARDVRATMTPVGITLGVALLLLYATLVPILRQVTRTLAARNERLAEHAGELRRALDERERAERKLSAAERGYRSLIEQLPLVTYIDNLDETSSAIYISPQVEDLLGYSPVAWLGDTEFFPKVLHPEDRERVLAQHAEAYAKAEPFTSEYRFVAKDGRDVWVQDHVMIARDDGGKPLHAQGFLLDVTERIRAEAEREAARRDLAAQNERLRELDKLKDEFIALVSHELRTPLTSIRGYTELLLDGEAGALTEEQRQFLAVVERNSHRLLHLVGDLLFLAQIEAGKLVLDVGALDLAALSSESVEAARPAAEEKGITLTLATGPVPLLAGDRARIGQLLDNLVSNGVKFTPAGGRVDVRVRMARRRAVIEVRDSGIGIPAGERQFLFQRFFRTSTATEQAIQGTGLGLAISKAIVEAHGGAIEVESEEGAGTTFRVTLPVGQQASETAPAAVAL